jgi:MFS family permease
MQRFPVGKYLGVNIFLWGFFLMLQGINCALILAWYKLLTKITIAAAKNFTQLAVLRVISGAAEACRLVTMKMNLYLIPIIHNANVLPSDPAFMLITSMWYTRRQQPIRIGLWYTANGFGIAIGGLFGYGIGQIKGALPSWNYEFLIIGALCCIWGIVMVIFLPDSPVTAPQLSDRQKRLAVERLRDNQTGVENRTMKPKQILEAFLDWKVWTFFLLGFSGNIPNGGISNFGTLIIKGFGFSICMHCTSGSPKI